MTSLRSISMSELAKNNTGLGLVKTGVSKGDKGPFVDPFTLGQKFPVEITGEEITARPSGTPQVAISVAIMAMDGSLKKAGKLWLDLPVATPGITAAQEATNVQKAGERFLKFLRALEPTQYNTWAAIDKTDPKKWVYLDFDGSPMTDKARTARAAVIDAAMVGVAVGLMAGTVSLVGSRCYVTKVANPNAPKYPFVNFDAIPSA